MNNYFSFEHFIDETKMYLNENGKYHRLDGPAIEWSSGDKSFFINDILYMKYFKSDNELIFYMDIFKLGMNYFRIIINNIKIIIDDNIDVKFNFYLVKNCLNFK